MNVQVTSVSKKEQKLSRIGAAVFVITQEDIRRSGSTNIPDILRMVPGVNVARIDAHTWSVSVRGFSELYGNKVLVMIDGRAMYRQSFSGVRWDEVDVPLESIERIEVIRGPGGTVWGANAVNGVINIISKSALDTQGGMLSTAVGSELLPDATLRFGAGAGPGGAYRVFGRVFNMLSSGVPGGGEQLDGSKGAHVGFRFDRELSARDSLMIEGDGVGVHATDALTAAFVGSSDPNAAFKPTHYTSGAVMARWSRAMENGGRLSLQFYNDYYQRLERDVTETRNTIDFSLENHLKIGARHDLVWGLGYRHTSDRITQGPITFDPPRRTDSLYSGFLQDEIRLTNWLALTLGAKLEHNPYTGFENEPSAQLVFTPSPRHTLWASAGRAVRQTSREETHLAASITNYPLPGGGFGELRVAGNPNPQTEHLSAFEGGYRVAAGHKLSLDLSAFSNQYRNLQTRESLVPFFVLTPTPHVVIPLIYDYKAHARSYGGEVTAKWTPVERLRLTAGYALLRIRVGLAPSIHDVTETNIAGSSPLHRVEVGTCYNLTRNLELDARVSYTGRLKTGSIPAFTGLNLRLGWRLSEAAEFSFSGENLMRPRHSEFPDVDAHLHTDAERSVTAKFTVRF